MRFNEKAGQSPKGPIVSLHQKPKRKFQNFAGTAGTLQRRLLVGGETLWLCSWKRNSVWLFRVSAFRGFAF
ncbi:hypothetical protein PIB30_029104 [Stylosanthes scabra]|uniref:Uncharacterized protein n=1 Tax=Stylosanthes scabra TaxID=79078 RepID=A0ABU6UCZ6_9FABA|nr:hypothetical protein [Stylosanthes scabra]